MSQHVRVADMAHAARCTAAHLSRVFRAHVGLPPRAWVARQKMRQAAFLLDSTDWPVARIAEAVGYQDQYLFSAVFKRVMKTSPRAYRKSLRKQPA